MRRWARIAVLLNTVAVVGCTPERTPATRPPTPAALLSEPHGEVSWLETVPAPFKAHFSCPTQAISRQSPYPLGSIDDSCSRRLSGCGDTALASSHGNSACPELFNVSFEGPAWVGKAWALRRSNAGWFGLHQTTGMVGPLAQPERLGWLGIDERDQLLAVDEGGRIYAAESVTAAMAGWTLRGRAPAGAHLWDLSSQVLVTAVKDSVYVSIDTGATFIPSQPQPGATITRLATRRDGVLAVMTEQGAARTSWTSLDHGAHYQRSAFQPEQLVREGSWIIGSTAECSAVLSRDGINWAPLPTHPSFDCRSLFDHSRLGQASLIESRGTRWIPAMVELARPQDAVTSCPTNLGRSHRTGPPQIQFDKVSWPDCHQNTDCLNLALDLSDEQVFSSSAWSWFHDGLCGTDGQARNCFAANMPFGRKPSLLRIDRHKRAAQAVRLPAHCEPQRLFHGRGLAVLLCDGSRPDTNDVYVTTSEDVWRRETSVPAFSDDVRFEVAADGTVGLLGWSTSRRPMAWLRSRARPGRARWRAFYPAANTTTAFRGLAEDGVAAIGIDYHHGLLTIQMSPTDDFNQPSELLRHQLEDVSILGVCRYPDHFEVVTSPRERLAEAVQVRRLEHGKLGKARSRPLALPLCSER